MNEQPSKVDTARSASMPAKVATVLAFPHGIFLLLGSCAVLRPRHAATLFVLSFGITSVMILGLTRTNHLPDVQRYLEFGLSAYCLALCGFQYALGSSAGLWSPRDRRAWKTLGAIALSGLVATGLLLVFRAS